jgi:hypothetical protein
MIDKNLKYEGQLKNGLRHGFGREIKTKVGEYEGKWAEGKKFGKG